MSADPMNSELLWPEYATPADLAAIESVPLQDRGMPETTYALLHRAATLWPERVAVSVLPDAEHWRQPVRRTYARLLFPTFDFWPVREPPESTMEELPETPVQPLEAVQRTVQLYATRLEDYTRQMRYYLRAASEILGFRVEKATLLFLSAKKEEVVFEK